MNVLVAAASKYGGTWEIARVIASRLGQRGARVSEADIEDFPPIDPFDAAVVGSGIYMGRWIAVAQEFVECQADDLRGVPVWLFSSGPLGESDTVSSIDAAFVDRLVATAGAREHKVFFGRLRFSELGLGDRLVARAVRATEGDFRHWANVNAWADQIAGELGLVGQPDMGTGSGNAREIAPSLPDPIDTFF